MGSLKVNDRKGLEMDPLRGHDALLLEAFIFKLLHYRISAQDEK